MLLPSLFSALHPARRGALSLSALACVSLALVACDGTPPPPPCVGADCVTEPDPTVGIPDIGATEFVSADGRQGQDTGRNDDGSVSEPGAPEPDAEGDGGDAAVEEGDIYRLLDNGLLANLNAYRGLQLIDIQDPSTPHIVGTYRVTGSPVEMYTHNNRAFILMNNWNGYYGSRTDIEVEQVHGGLLVVLDISNPAAPSLVDQGVIPGWIQKSRLRTEGDQAALYVVTSDYVEVEGDGGTTSSWETRTIVKSFDVSAPQLEERSQLDLGGYVTDIQATPEALLVARYDWRWNEGEQERSQVAIIDINSADGTMLEGASVEVRGYVRNQFYLDMHNDVLRVVSDGFWGGAQTNHLETFDVTDIHNVTAIDHVTFGDNEDLYGAIFLGNKAFFVTYFRTDPFHAFEITDEGLATERSEFIVSGWNDFFRPVFDNTRLVGIGVNDENNRTMAVSLYDITDLDNAEPLLTRAEVEASSSWSEASWDHRAFSVVQNAVDVQGPNGEAETGLVLLPYSGYSDDHDSYVAAVQIFTFSETSLTRRSSMVQGTRVRRSFPTDNATANLSDYELSLFNTDDPDNVDELGRLELAPNFTDIMRLGAYSLRVKNAADAYNWWGTVERPNAVVDVIDASADPDTAPAVASFTIPYNASVYLSGTNFVAITMVPDSTDTWPYTYTSTVEVTDLSDPTSPTEAGAFTTDRLTPSYGGYGLYDDCWDCGWGYGYGFDYGDDAISVTDGVALLQREQKSELVAREEVCVTYVNDEGDCLEAEDGTWSCTYTTGSIRCATEEGSDETLCTGSIQQCTYSGSVDGEEREDCEEIDDLRGLPTEENCYDNDRYRYWQEVSLEVIDLSDPMQPQLSAPVELTPGDNGVRLLQDGNTAWIAFNRPVDVDNDPLPYVRYYAQSVDLSDVSAPQMGAAVNVPGELFAVTGDTVLTRDVQWGEDEAVTLVHRLDVADGVATLRHSHNFEDRMVQNVMLDGAGHVLATHRPSYNVDNHWEQPTQLTLFALDDLTTLSTIDVDRWATLRTAVAGRALFQVSGGILTFDLSTPASPAVEGFFATRGWPRAFVLDGDDVLFAAGRFGVYKFRLGDFNILPL